MSDPEAKIDQRKGFRPWKESYLSFSSGSEGQNFSQNNQHSPSNMALTTGHGVTGKLF